LALAVVPRSLTLESSQNFGVGLIWSAEVYSITSLCCWTFVCRFLFWRAADIFISCPSFYASFSAAAIPEHRGQTILYFADPSSSRWGTCPAVKNCIPAWQIFSERISIQTIPLPLQRPHIMKHLLFLRRQPAFRFP
jgi:hypothetical protein